MKNSLRQTVGQLFVVAILLGSSANGSATTNENLISRIQRFFSDGANTAVGETTLRHNTLLTEIYQQRKHKPIWIQNNRFSSTALAILKKLEAADQEGLTKAEYLTAMLRHWEINGSRSDLLSAELFLTDSLLEYYHDLALGVTPVPTKSQGWSLPKAKVNVAEITQNFFDGTATHKQVLSKLRPTHRNYHLLVSALARYQQIAAHGGWPTIATNGTIREGDYGPRIADLKSRLRSTGDLRRNSSAGNYFDASTKSALMTFQTRHGLHPDGLAGTDTLAQLNQSVEQRIAQIKINLERWRWMPRELGKQNIIVNIAGSELEVNHNNEVVTQMRVVVGKPQHQTPLFSDELEYLVFNPAWHVPTSITRKLLKKERRRPGYLSKLKYEAIPHSRYVKIPASSLHREQLQEDSFLSKYRLRQAPGNRNTLGTLKFMFPNKYSVYLHDTQDRRLFAKSERAFSHGCVRVEDPQRLARVILNFDGITDPAIDNLLTSKKTVKLALSQSIPVHLTYQTAWVDRNGQMQFRRDFYQLDRSPLKSLKKNQTKYAALEAQLLDTASLVVASRDK